MWGGGIFCGNSSPMIAYNTITGNSCWRGGGGICIVLSSGAVITNNLISEKGADDGSSGGGILCYE
jgi:parallel beta-helix repeat protein